MVFDPRSNALRVLAAFLTRYGQDSVDGEACQAVTDQVGEGAAEQQVSKQEQAMSSRPVVAAESQQS